MTFCLLCRSIPFRGLPEAPTITRRYILGPHVLRLEVAQDDFSETNPIWFPYHRDIEALAASAHSCKLCRLINSEATSWLESMGYIETEGSPKFRSVQQLWLTKRFHGSDGFIVVTKAPRAINYESDFISSTEGLSESDSISSTEDLSESDSIRSTEGLSESDSISSTEDLSESDSISSTEGLCILAGIGFCVRKEDPLASEFPMRPIQQDSSSPASLDVAEAWLKTCMYSHQQCSSGPASLPTRILDVGKLEDVSIRLLETSGARGEYVSLSHCWGAGNHFTTSSENVNLHMQGINIDRLPKTFQDAVTITRRLGFHYLWIDSLCICQDDKVEWAHESARMNEVYSNASLVVAADHAAHNAAGCFNIRQDRHSMNVRLPLDKEGSEVVETIPLRPDKEFMSGRESGWENEPLNQRGWTFQERCLARRTLHYCTDQMYFECNHGIISEDGCRFDRRFCAIPAEIDRDYGLECWYDLVKRYSRRETTRRTDKLPALSGLAKAFSHRIGAEYVVGLWSNDLIRGLAWSTVEHKERGESEESYTAPSWSWASTDSEVKIMWSTSWRDIAVVEGFSYVLKTSNPFGEVNSGRIELTAPVIPVQVSGGLYKSVRLRLPMPDKEFEGYFDSPRQSAHEFSPTSKLFLLVLGSHEVLLGTVGHNCLILAPSEEPVGAFRRVGHCPDNNLSQFTELEQHKKTITLV